MTSQRDRTKLQRSEDFTSAQTQNKATRDVLHSTGDSRPFNSKLNKRRITPQTIAADSSDHYNVGSQCVNQRIQQRPALPKKRWRSIARKVAQHRPVNGHAPTTTTKTKTTRTCISYPRYTGRVPLKTVGPSSASGRRAISCTISPCGKHTHGSCRILLGQYTFAKRRRPQCETDRANQKG